MSLSRFTVNTCAQRTPEWFQARCGRLTASVASAALAGLDTAKRRDLLYRLVTERLTGQPQEDEGFKSAPMVWGTEHEGEALLAYEARTGHITMPVGFIALRDLPMGCSPDAVIGEPEGLIEGLVSLKCPKTSTHVSYLRANRVPPDYMPQVLCELFVTGAAWCDFLSYDPRLPDRLQTFLVRYQRDEAAIADFERKALAFLADVDTELQALRTMANHGAVLQEAVSA